MELVFYVASDRIYMKHCCVTHLYALFINELNVQECDLPTDRQAQEKFNACSIAGLIKNFNTFLSRINDDLRFF